MLDVAPSEFLLLAIVALVVIGPKDLPKAMRVLGYWVGRARGVARQFRSGFDNMVREAELAEMEKKWAAENERIMKEHGAGGPEEAEASAGLATAAGEAGTASSDGAATSPAAEHPDLFTQPITVEKPQVAPASASSAPAADAKADS